MRKAAVSCVWAEHSISQPGQFAKANEQGLYKSNTINVKMNFGDKNLRNFWNRVLGACSVQYGSDWC